MLGTVKEVKLGNELPKMVRHALYGYHSGQRFFVHSFCEQVVNGMNYFVKFQSDYVWYHGKVHLSFEKEIEVLEVRSFKEKDVIEYF